MPLSFEPRLDILPESQRELWPDLDAVPSDFVLYGGTALALQLGQRISEDFDFFSSAGFDPNRLWVHYKRDNLEGYVQRPAGTVRTGFLVGWKTSGASRIRGGRLVHKYRWFPS